MNVETRNRVAYLALAVTLATPFITALRAQRLPNRINPAAKVVLRGSRNPRIDKLTGEGPVEDTKRIPGMTLRFRPTDKQSAELEQLLEDQQNPSSPLYHAWLTPEEYGDRFGITVEDYLKVADWVVAQGFQIDRAARSRTYISFSGTAAQVRDTFGTELHRFRMGGVTHYANTREAAIPVDLAPFVTALVGLDDFPDQTHVKPTKPRITGKDGSHALTPGDLAIIYNVNPVYKAGLIGVGQRIVVTGQSAFNVQDIDDFRDAAMLPPTNLKVMLVPGSPDPGITDDSGEAVLDVEYAGGAAPGAIILFVYAKSVGAATEYAIDQNLAPVISHSFGTCEKRATSAWTYYRELAQQAAAQGITWLVASGDTGPAGCDSQVEDAAGLSGISAGLPASIPEVTAVGGSMFVEGNGTYWSKTNLDNGASALSYIPEVGWNESGPGKLLGASGGGISNAYPRPSWQTGPGVPNDNWRHVPDVAFAAASEHDPYLVIDSGHVRETGGTSAGTPFFAGVVALLNQYVVASGAQAKPGLGNINPRLYQLAQASKGVFHDITAGNNIVPCKAGTPDCNNGQYGYNAGPGYDHVTGLGSIDVTNLFVNWVATDKAPQKTASVVVPSVEPSPVYEQAADADGFAWFYTVRLTETGGAPTTITGFAIDGYDLTEYLDVLFGTANLPAGGSLSVDLRAKNLEVPSDHVFVFAGVDGSGQKWAKQVTASFRGPQPGSPGTQKTAAAMSLTSDPAVVVKIGKGDPNCSADHPFGQVLTLRELNGSAVKLTKFLAGGNDFSDRIASWFGTQTLPASGSLQTRICWQLTTLPVTLAYEVDGIDGAGNAVQATLKVDFKNPLDQKSGAIATRSGAVSEWPGAHEPSAERDERRRRSNSVHRTPGGMVIARRSPMG